MPNELPARTPRGAASTRWSVILAAGDQDPDKARPALEVLCQTYWPAVYALARHEGASPNEAEDLVQAFFADFLERGHVVGVAAEIRSFRAWLRGAFRNFWSKQREHDRAARRGGHRTILPLDLKTAEPTLPPDLQSESPEKTFHRAFIRALLDAAEAAVLRDYEDNGQALLCKELLPKLLRQGDGETYGEVATRLKSTEAALKVAAHRLRQRFGQKVRQLLAETMHEGADVGEELRNLLECL